MKDLVNKLKFDMESGCNRVEPLISKQDVLFKYNFIFGVPNVFIFINFQTEGVPVIIGDLENAVNVNQPIVTACETVKENDDKAEPEKKKPVSTPAD